MTSTTYLSLGAFYGTDPRRAHSREVDLGLWWRGHSALDPTYRAAFVEDTGEVYVMQHEGTRGGGRVDVLRAGARLEDVLADLDGWELACGDPDSVSWLLERLRPAARSVPRPVAVAA